MRRTLTIFIFLLAFTSSYAQKTQNETKLEFTKQEVFNDYKIVYFVLDHSATEVEFKEIYLAMRDDSKIIEITIDGSKSCKAKLALDVTPEYIQKYLIQSGFNFAYEVVNKQLSVVDKNQKNMLPIHYPEKTKADGKEVDAASYKQAIEFWKRKYPQEWIEYQKYNTDIKK